MKNPAFIFTLVGVFFLTLSIEAQELTHEVGVMGGPLIFRSDYGLKSETDINIDNVGVGIGVAYYLGFGGAGCDCLRTNSYFSEHFKVRVELDYHHTSLEHRGKLADQNDTLSSMHGKTSVIEIGPSLEWYPFGAKTYYAKTSPFAPYVALGLNYTYYNPDSKTDLPGKLGSASNTYHAFLDDKGNSYLTTASDDTFSIVGSIGTRYRLNDFGDLVLDAQIHYYGSNAVDGIDRPQRRINDWIAWLKVGYVYHF